jgi:hypothetical protein
VTRTNPDAPDSEEDRRLMALADSIDEGDEVDWDAAERSAASDTERAAIRELRVVEGVARVCRDPDTPVAGLGDTMDLAESRLGTWERFELIEAMGEGAYARVYRAFDPTLRRDVALKIFAVDRGSPDAERVRREGRLLARLDHRGVVRVRELVECDEGIALVMELVDGFTLEEELHARGRMGESEAIAYGRELCQALAAVHAEGLLHRDIKAQNAMRDNSGRIILMDLGAGLDAAHAPAGEIGTMAGTPLYLAPELLAGAPPSRPSDLYSLGVLLFHIVSGGWPVEGSTLEEVVDAHAANRRRRLRDVRSDLSAPFVDLIERVLDADPGRRFQTAGELDLALSAIGPPRQSGSVSRTSVEPPTPPGGFAWWRFAVVATALVALAVLGSVMGLPDMWDGSTRLLRGVEAGPAPAAASVAPAAVDPARYTLETRFYRVGNRHETLLADGSTVRLGDLLALKLRATRDVYVYVVNEDDAGEANLLFPLPGQMVTNPLPGGREHRLPGIVEGKDMAWTVTSSGGAEHFLLFVSPTRLEEVEKALLDDLPKAAENRRIQSARLSEASLGRLRGVGGLAAVRPAPGAMKGRLSQIAERLSSATEQATGVWVRQVTFESPGSTSRPTQ